MLFKLPSLSCSPRKLIQIALAQSFPWGFNQTVSQDHARDELPRSLTRFWIQFLVGCWTKNLYFTSYCEEASLSSMAQGSLHRTAQNMAATFPRGLRGGCPRWKSQSFYNLIPGVASHPFGHILFVRTKPPVPASRVRGG